MPLTGAGTTAVFSSGITGTVANVRSIDGFMEDVTDIERPLLADAAGAQLKYMPSDRILHDRLVMEVEFNPDDFASATALPLHTTATLTITFQVPSGSTNGATLAGTGYIAKRNFNTVEPGASNPITGNVEFRFDGTGTPFDYTASS